MRKEALIDRCFRAVMKCSGVGLGNACPRGDAQTASRTADRCGPKAGTVGLKGRREERDEGENRKNLCDTMGSASSAGSPADEAETICFILEGGSRKKLPLGVSLWGKSVYTSSCDERGLTLKGSPRSRGATAFSPLVAASKKASLDNLSSRRCGYKFQVPRTRNNGASVCSMQPGWSPGACASTKALVRLAYGSFGLVL